MSYHIQILFIFLNDTLLAEAVRQTYTLDAKPKPTAPTMQESVDAPVTEESQEETLAQPELPSLPVATSVANRHPSPTQPPTSLLSFPGGVDQQHMGLHQPRVMQIPGGTTFPESCQHDMGFYQGESSGSLSYSGLQQDLTMATSGYTSYTEMLSGGSEGDTGIPDTNWAELQELMGPEFNNAALLQMERNANEIANQNLNELTRTTNLFLPTPVLPVITSQSPLPVVASAAPSFNIQADVSQPPQPPQPVVASQSPLPVVASAAPSFNIQPDEPQPPQPPLPVVASPAPSFNIQQDESGPSTGQTEQSRVTGDEPESSVRLRSRNRKPTGRREVIPLTAAKDGSVALPAWLESSLAYLSEGVEEKIWAECLGIWVEFEKDCLLDVASVSPRMERVHLN